MTSRDRPDDRKAAFVEETKSALLDHFKCRWGQDAPLTEAEAELVADQLWRKVQRLFP